MYDMFYTVFLFTSGHGDIGTAATDADGHINHTFTHSTFTMKGDHDIIGRSVVVSSVFKIVTDIYRFSSVIRRKFLLPIWKRGKGGAGEKVGGGGARFICFIFI